MQNDLSGLYQRKQMEIDEGKKLVLNDNLLKKKFDENRK